MSVSIEELRKNAQWTMSDWQLQLLQEADRASDGPDGKISVAELDRYLADPGRRFVTRGRIAELSRAIAGLPQPQDGRRRGGRRRMPDPRAPRPYDSLPRDWRRELIRKADEAQGADGHTTLEEVREYLEGRAAVVPEQGVAMLRSTIARHTDEHDLLRIEGPGTHLIKSYLRLVHDDERRIPTVVSYVLHAADLVESSHRRISRFERDSAIPDGARPSDYGRKDHDKGHMMPAADCAELRCSVEANSMSNISPQAAALNQGVWRALEDALREVVDASGGRAYVFTGSLFLDERGRPMSKRAVERGEWIGSGRERRVAVPTHYFKAVLIELPNGHFTTLGYLLPNRDDLATERDGLARLLHGARRSVRDLEQLSGRDFFRDLPDAIETPMEQSTSHTVPLLRNVSAATLLWPKEAPRAWAPPSAASPTWYERLMFWK